jgi:predicted transcriptional regulator
MARAEVGMIGPEVAGFSKASWLKAAHGFMAQNKMTTAQIMVLIDLYCLAPSDGREVAATVEWLAERNGISAISARRALRRLADLGLVIRRVRGGNQGCCGRPSVYDLGLIEVKP